MPRQQETYDVIVIGGGPAGLSAALWLARYRHRVVCFDAQDPRNAEAWAVHGYLGMQDVPPFELRRVGREQAIDAGAEFEAAVVERVEGETDDFRVVLADGRAFRGRRVLFCTGLKDIIPEIPGLMDFYGTSIWHCPDCDGPSVPDLKVGVIGWGHTIAAFCMWMLTWTDRMVVLTHGHPRDFSESEREVLDRHGIRVRTEVIDRLEGEEGQVRRAVFHDGSTEDLDAMFFHIASGPGCSIPADLGCKTEEIGEGILRVDDDFQTTVPGVYAAGDITPGSRLAIRAAYEGARAAVGIHKSLLPEDRKL